MSLPQPNMHDSKFYVYSKADCGFCTKLLEFMDKRNIVYEEFKLDSDFSRKEFIDKFGQGTTFPQVLRGHQRIGGMKESVRYLIDQNIT